MSKIARWQAQHEFFAALLDALGYPCSPTLKPLDEGSVPILGEIKKKSGAPDWRAGIGSIRRSFRI
jgi:hypothetical protein